MCVCVFSGWAVYMMTLPASLSSPLEASGKAACVFSACMCVLASAQARAHKLVGQPRSGWWWLYFVWLGQPLLSPLQTPWINAREDRLADQKTTNYTAARLTPGGQGRERDGDLLNTPQGRINRREWGHRLTEGLLGSHTYTVVLKGNINPSMTLVGS